MKKTNQKGAVLVGGNTMTWDEIRCFVCGGEIRLQRGVLRLDESGNSIFRFMCACDERSCKISDWWIIDGLNVMTKTCCLHKILSCDAAIEHDTVMGLLHPEKFSMEEFQEIRKRVARTKLIRDV